MDDLNNASQEAVVNNDYVKPKRKKYKLHLTRQIKYSDREKWLSFYPNFGKLCFRIMPSSYFDERAQLNVYLTTLIAIAGFIVQLFGILPTFMLGVWSILLIIPWGQMFLNFPLYSGIEECEHPKYGFYLYGERPFFDSFWWCWGMKNHCFNMPWSWDWVRTSNLRKDGTWEHEVKGSRKDFYEDKWKEVIWNETYPYSYVLNSGKIQERTATIKVEEREWRWRGFKWSAFPKMIRRTIDVQFNDEVGERTGSWKGGTLGCGYNMLPNESPLDCLRRMEKERKF